MNAIPFSAFKSALDKNPAPGLLPWSDLAAKLTTHKAITVPGLARVEPGSEQWKTLLDEAKKKNPALSPVRYKEGATRGNAGVEEVSCFICDLDDVSAEDLAALRARWKAPDGSPLAWCLYSTVKHRAETPRLRVVFPLAAPVPAVDWPRVWWRLTHWLTADKNDPATKDAARLHFLPIVPRELKEQAFSDMAEGVFLDPNAFDPAPLEREALQIAQVQGKEKPLGLSSTGGEGKPGHDFNEKATPAELLALLVRHGWQEHSRRGSAIYVTRPGKDTRAGLSGVIGWPGDPSPVFYCLSSSAAPLEVRAYAPFGLYGTLEHGGRFEEAARELGKRGYGEPLPSSVTRDIASAQKGKPLAERQEQAKETFGLVRLGDFNKTDAGNAERLILRNGQDLRFVPGLGWRVWDGKRWAADESSVTRYARETIRALYAEAAELLTEAHQEPDREVRKQLAASAEELSRFAIKSESTRALAAMVDQAKSFSEIAADASQFNLKPWQVPFQNGVWDRGKWRGHQRQDFTEHLLPVCYDKDADRAEWYALLERMTGGDAQFARTLQDVAGYCLSGASTLRLLPWAYGPKGTGKSTFAELLQTALGATGKTIDSSLLSGDREDERLGAAIRGMRAIFLPEAGRKRLDAETLKSLTGSDRRPARDLYSTVTLSIVPSWAVFAVANDPPSMNAHDDALRDRVIALPFEHRLDQGEDLTFRDGKRLEEVRRKPDSALVAGFVVWAVEGLERVHEAQAVYKAPVVSEHTRKFWDDTDPLTPFWEGLDKSELARGMGASVLHRSYVSWCEQEGVKRPLQGRAFAAACRVAGLEQKRGEKGIVWFQPPPSLPLQGTEIPVGMYERPPFSEKSPKKESIGDFSENTPESYIPTGINESDDLPDPYAETPGGSRYSPPVTVETEDDPLEEIF